jgi:hypothetical protein
MNLLGSPLLVLLWKGTQNLVIIAMFLCITCCLCTVASHLKTMIPVGYWGDYCCFVKYAVGSRAVPALNMCWAHTTNPSRPIAIMANNSYVSKSCLSISFMQMMCEIIPNPGNVRIYASGCGRNQNACWYRIGSLRAWEEHRSDKIAVIAPNRRACWPTAQKCTGYSGNQQ